jgi:RNA polymerase sigma-70 factor (ECF subfamily)
MPDADSILVERCRRGEKSAFDELVARHAPAVGCIAYNIVGDVEHARDLTQDVFLKAYRSLGSLEDPSRFKFWLSTITRTTCVDWLRREKVRPASLDALRESGAEPGVSCGPETVPTPAETEEVSERVLSAVRSLPRIYQDAILLKHLKKMSYEQIAEFTGTTVATVESRLYRAKLLLRERLRGLVKGPGE